MIQASRGIQIRTGGISEWHYLVVWSKELAWHMNYHVISTG